MFMFEHMNKLKDMSVFSNVKLIFQKIWEKTADTDPSSGCLHP